MFNRIRGHQGFTLIELMIVVAIIGILAAIAIPNFMQYQLKSKTSEAKTNLNGVKTGMVAFQGERGCVPGLAAAVPAAPGTGGFLIPAWVPLPAAVIVTTPLLCAPPPAVAVFTTVAGAGMDDIGFRPTGPVRYSYFWSPQAAPTSVVPGTTAGCTGSAAASTPAMGVPVGGAFGNLGYIATAVGDLDNSTAAAAYATSDSSSVVDCNPGAF